MATSPQIERKVQEAWQPRAGMKDLRAFDELIGCEFTDPVDRDRELVPFVKNLLGFARDNVPYYWDLFERANFDPATFDRLDRLTSIPVLAKENLLTEFDRLHAQGLPQGQAFGGYTQSSGTTGPPVRVANTKWARQMFGLLKQREMRWFRIDPAKTLGWLRVPENMPLRDDGSRAKDEETIENEAWPVVGAYFETGPFLGYHTTTPIDSWLDWLTDHSPNYLSMASGPLEHLALAAVDGKARGLVVAVTVMGEELTEGMRARASARLDTAVFQNYGLNEVGIVAARCSESGLYHIHSEHVLVEIVDAEGQRCAQGERGRILVTALNNFAMPIIRYDTGDLAVATSRACPCGRTLPSFEAPILRRKRVDPLPDGSLERIYALRAMMEHMDDDLVHPVRSYRIHQDLKEDYTLMLTPIHAPSDGFVAHVQSHWAKISANHGTQLKIETMDRLPISVPCKFRHYTSEYISPDDRAG